MAIIKSDGFRYETTVLCLRGPGIWNVWNLCKPSVVPRVNNRRGAEKGGATVTSEEARLIEKAKAGDASAYERLVHAHEAVAFRTACLITGEAGEAEDAAQEAFVKAYRALNHFRRGAAFRPWLLSIVANEAKNRRKAAGRRTSLALRLAERHRPEGTPDREGSPEAETLENERRAELLDAVSRLDERDRLILAYRYFLGLSEEETAAALGCARGTVKSRLSRALGRLRKKMSHQTEVKAGKNHVR